MTPLTIMMGIGFFVVGCIVIGGLVAIVCGVDLLTIPDIPEPGPGPWDSRNEAKN